MHSSFIYLAGENFKDVITPSNSHPNGTVKPNTNTNCKQMALKTIDNYLNTLQLCFMSLLYLFSSISTPTDNKSLSFGVSPGLCCYQEKGVQH